MIGCLTCESGAKTQVEPAGALVVDGERELERLALVRLAGAREQAQPEAAGVAVAEAVERKPAQHLAAELEVGEALLVGGVGQDLQHLARLLADEEGLGGADIVVQFSVAAERRALAFDLGLGDRRTAAIGSGAGILGPPHSMKIDDRKQHGTLNHGRACWSAMAACCRSR